jgi:hypothetical protein
MSGKRNNKVKDIWNANAAFWDNAWERGTISINCLLNLIKSNYLVSNIREPSFKYIDSQKIYDNVYKNIPPAIIYSFRLMK